MKNSLLVSIIVPVYNAEKYLVDCVNSLLNQTYKNIEIILINDGSTDNSYQIMRKLKKENNRIITIKQKNKGANAARLAGIKKASGDYIMFVDADDWLELNAVETLMKIIKQKKVDHVRFNGILEPSKKIKNNYDFQDNKLVRINKEKIYQLFIETKILHNLCFGIYRASLLKDIDSFKSNISFAEDFWANLDILPQTKSIILLNENLYHYRENISSTTYVLEKDKVLKNTYEAIFVYQKLFDYLVKWNRNSKENKIKISFATLEIVRWMSFKLFRIKELSKAETIHYIEEIFEQEVFSRIRENVSFKDLKQIIKQQPLKFKVKNYRNFKLLYKRKYKKLSINKYLYSINF